MVSGNGGDGLASSITGSSVEEQVVVEVVDYNWWYWRNWWWWNWWSSIS
jgi:hypothetical protein